MNREITALQNLISEIDDARIFFREIAGRFNQPFPKRLLARVAQTHVAIAEDLADRVRAGGEEPARTGGKWRGLRLRYADLHARFALDPELDRMLSAERREARVVRCFDDALLHGDVRIRRRLQLHKRELERAHNEIGLMVHAMTGARQAHA